MKERARDWRNQCQMTALRGGWNACVLVAGHEGEHASDSGSERGPWVSREEARVYFAAQYRLRQDKR